MIAQSIYHGVSRFVSRGRKLCLKSLETHAGRECQRFGDDDCDTWLKILAVAVKHRRIVRRLRNPVPFRVVTFELEGQTESVVSESLLFVPGQNSRVPLDQLVIVA